MQRWNKTDARREAARIVRGARLKLNWSVGFVASEAGVARASVNLIENGAIQSVVFSDVGDVADTLMIGPAQKAELLVLHGLSFETPRRRRRLPQRNHFPRRQPPIGNSARQ